MENGKASSFLARIPWQSSSRARTLRPQAMAGVHEKVAAMLSQECRDRDIVVLGSGHGDFEQRLLEMGTPPWRITSVDINPGQFVFEGLFCHRCDLNQRLPFADDSFDLAVAIEVIEHLQFPQNLVDETYRLLRPGGRLFVTTPNVHSFPQKLRYLFSDQFLGFQERQFQGSGHLHPIFHWLLERMVRQRFRIATYDSNRFQLRPIPFLPGLPVPFRHRFFAAINIYELRSLKPPAAIASEGGRESQG